MKCKFAVLPTEIFKVRASEPSFFRLNSGLEMPKFCYNLDQMKVFLWLKVWLFQAFYPNFSHHISGKEYI